MICELMNPTPIPNLHYIPNTKLTGTLDTVNFMLLNESWDKSTA